MLRLPPKDPAEVLDFTIDWHAPLGDDQITASTVTVTGATKVSDGNSNDDVTVWISGGTPGTIIRIVNTITTLAGRTYRRLAVIPFGEPVSLELAKAQCRIDPEVVEEDELIAGYISSARSWVEETAGLILVRRTIAEHFTHFERVGLHGRQDYLTLRSHRRYEPSLSLLSWPVVSVDSVAYTDVSGDPATITDYRAVLTGRPAKLYPARNTYWPCISAAEGVDVTLTAGFADGDAPDAAIQAMLLTIGHWYRNRESVVAGDRAAAIEVPQGAVDLCDKLRLQRV